MDRVVNYGIIGAGHHGYEHHFKPGLTVPGLKLVALCDPELGSPGAFVGMDAVNVTLYRTLNEFLAHPGLDAVVIASPDRFHTSQLDAAIVAGKHALVDKPAAANMADIIQLQATLDKAKSAGLVVTSCHPRRFNHSYASMKTRLDGWIKDFGAAIRLELDFGYRAPKRAGLHTGLLADHMNHEVDYMNFLFGRSGLTAMRLTDSQQRYEAAGIRKDGVSFHFSGTRLLDNRKHYESIRIRFERGSVHLQVDTGVLTVCHHDYQNLSIENRTTTFFHTIASPDIPGSYAAVMRDFASAILDGTPPYLTQEDIYFNSLVCVELTERKACDIRCDD
jgi:predicted dehydrogenase